MDYSVPRDASLALRWLVRQIGAGPVRLSDLKRLANQTGVTEEALYSAAIEADACRQEVGTAAEAWSMFPVRSSPEATETSVEAISRRILATAAPYIYMHPRRRRASSLEAARAIASTGRNRKPPPPQKRKIMNDTDTAAKIVAAEHNRWKTILAHATKMGRYPLGVKLGATSLSAEAACDVIDAAESCTSADGSDFAAQVARFVRQGGNA